jgi:hypothetical protein
MRNYAMLNSFPPRIFLLIFPQVSLPPPWLPAILSPDERLPAPAIIPSSANRGLHSFVNQLEFHSSQHVPHH